MQPIEFDPGALSVRLRLERPVTGEDGQGGVTTGYATQAEVWARIEPLAAVVEEVADAGRVRVSHAVWLRFRGDVAAGMRFVKGSRRLVIESAHDPDESGRFLLCHCREEGR